MALRLMPRSPGSQTSFWPPSPCELAMHVSRLGPLHLRKSLTVAMTARTTRFCRTRTHPPQGLPACAHGRQNVGETSLQRRSSAHGFGFTGTTRPPRTFLCPTLPHPPHPSSRHVTIYDRPSWRAGMDNTYDKSEFR